MSSGQLRIAMLSAHSCPVGNLGTKDTGGMSVYIREVARELGKQGHLVDVYTRVHDPTDPRIIPLGYNAQLIHLKAGAKEKIHKLVLYPFLPDFACNLENFRKENNLQYDLVFSHYWLSALVGEYLKQWWHVPHFTMFHTLGIMKNAAGIGEDEPELRIVTEKDLAQKCSHIIAATAREKEDLIQHYGALPERISVIPCGVNLELFHPVSKETAKQQMGLTDSKIILFVGRIEPLKGIDQLLRAMPYLKNGQRPKLVIIGGDKHSRHELEQLQKLARALQIQDSVDFLGLVKQERMPYLYSAADVCVVPSYYESFGLVALESLACGTPVVATDVGNLKSIIRQGETGYVITDNTPQFLADKIALLLSRPNHDTNAALSIRASVNEFGWANIAVKIAEQCRLAVADNLTPVA